MLKTRAFLAPLALVVMTACQTTALKDSATELVDRQYQAYEAKNLDGFMAFYSDNAKICQIEKDKCATGAKEIKEVYTKLFAASEYLKVTISRRIREGDYVIDWENVEFKIDGAIRKISGISIYQIKNGKIQNLQLFELSQVK